MSSTTSPRNPQPPSSGNRAAPSRVTPQRSHARPRKSQVNISSLPAVQTHLSGRPPAIERPALSARSRSRLSGCDAWEAPGGNRGIMAAIIPGLAPGVSFRVDHESCAGAWHLSARSRSGLYSISSARLPCGSAACGCPALGNPQRKLGARRRLLTQVAHVKHGRGAYRFAKIWTSSGRPGSLPLCGIFSVFLRGNSDC